MCRDLREELSSLNLQACGSLSDAEAQRLVHQTLFENVQTAGRKGGVAAYNDAVDAWDAHIAEHKNQARRIRQSRVK